MIISAFQKMFPDFAAQFRSWQIEAHAAQKNIQRGLFLPKTVIAVGADRTGFYFIFNPSIRREQELFQYRNRLFILLVIVQLPPKIILMPGL